MKYIKSHGDCVRLIRDLRTRNIFGCFHSSYLHKTFFVWEDKRNLKNAVMEEELTEQQC